MIAMKDMDDLTLKNAVYTFISSYRPWILKEVIDEVVLKNLSNEPLKGHNGCAQAQGTSGSLSWRNNYALIKLRGLHH